MPNNLDISAEADRVACAHPGWADAVLSSEAEDWLEDVFKHHPPMPQDTSKYVAIRSAASVFARVILEAAPKCADQSAALRHVRDAMMTANAAISLKGRV